MSGSLGRRTPTDWEHVEKYPFSARVPATVEAVEKTLVLPWWHWTHDQGREGSCVGHGVAMERAITNTAQNRLLALLSPSRRYDPISIWNYAKEIDEWPDTNPGDDNGTSVRAGYQTTVEKGARRVNSMVLVNNVPEPQYLSPWKLDAGVSAYRWAVTVDEIRTAVAIGLPVSIGVNWYSNFDNPVEKPGGLFGKSEWWIGELGWHNTNIRGGHCLCIYGASDKKQGFKLKNSWGKDYPLTWITYAAMQALLNEDGEAAIVTDR